MILVLPLQMVFASILAMRFRMNVPFAILGCWVSNVFTNLPIGMVQVRMGDWMRDSLGIRVPGFEGVQISFMGVAFNAASFILGMIASGVLLALIAYPIVHLFALILPQHLPVIRRRKTPKEQVL